MQHGMRSLTEGRGARASGSASTADPPSHLLSEREQDGRVGALRVRILDEVCVEGSLRLGGRQGSEAGQAGKRRAEEHAC